MGGCVDISKQHRANQKEATFIVKLPEGKSENIK